MALKDSSTQPQLMSLILKYRDSEGKLTQEDNLIIFNQEEFHNIINTTINSINKNGSVDLIYGNDKKPRHEITPLSDISFFLLDTYSPNNSRKRIIGEGVDIIRVLTKDYNTYIKTKEGK